MSNEDIIEFKGLPAVRVQSPDGAQVTITLHGAHIVSWISADGHERLYLSERSAFVAGKPIRGGIPLVFPQFYTCGPLPRHGFARNMTWQLDKVHKSGEFTGVTLSLTDSPETLAIWPFAFRCELTLSVARNRLDVEFGVENPGPQALSFTCALHTYLRVEHIETVQLMGLQGCTFRDQTRGNVERVEEQSALEFSDEIDRVYFTAPRDVMLREPNRSLNILSTNFPDLVVWNPWVEKCAQIPDMPADGFKRMLCVEAAVVEQPVQLTPGAEWWARQSLVAVR